MCVRAGARTRPNDPYGKKPVGQEVGVRESWESAARAFARALTSESQPNTCVYAQAV